MLGRGQACLAQLIIPAAFACLVSLQCHPAEAFARPLPAAFSNPTGALLGRAAGVRSGRQVCRLRGGAAGAMMGSKDVQFVTNKMCPFAQKVWVCLEEKKTSGGAAAQPGGSADGAQVDYDLVEVGLYGAGGKPEWFMKLNPRGLVPVLKHGDKGVTESNDICRYIDANFGDKGALCPEGTDAWMRLMDGEVLPAGKRMVNGGSDPESFHNAIAKFEAGVKGPFLMGDAFSLADVTAAPMMWRIMTEKRLGVTPDRYPRTCAWMDRVKGRPSFSRTVVSSWWWWW